MTRIVSQEEFQAWKQHPVTEAFMGFLSNERERFKAEWAEGGFHSERNPTLTHQLTLQALTKCQTLQEVLALSSDVINGGVE